MTEKGKTKGGMICGIIGTAWTFVTIGIMAALGLGIFAGQSIQANKDAMINDLHKIAASATKYKNTTGSNQGGVNSYIGFRIPDEMASNDNAKYSVQVISPTNIKLTAVSSQNEENTIVVFVTNDGSMIEWSYTGDFQ